MSHNLYFRQVRPNGQVEFPFQTPTELSYRVIKESNNSCRLAIIKQYLEQCNWPVDKMRDVIYHIDALMHDENLTLMVD